MVSISYNESDYDKLLDMTRHSIMPNQPPSPGFQTKLDPVLRDNEKLKKIQKIKDDQLLELKKKVKLDWRTKRQLLIEVSQKNQKEQQVAQLIEENKINHQSQREWVGQDWQKPMKSLGLSPTKRNKSKKYLGQMEQVK